MNSNKQRWYLILFLMVSLQKAYTQEVEEHIYERAVMETEENLRDQNESEGLPLRQQININKATIEDLFRLGVLSPKQISQFILFRATFGNFISMAELQAIPYWDIITIRQVAPFFHIDNTEQPRSSIKKILNNGEHIVLYRTGGKISDTIGNATTSGQRSTEIGRNKYAQLLNYRFNSRDNVHWGFTTEKDAGEKNVLDHYSGYLMISKMGVVNRLIVGDYIVNMGQGLIQWQGHAFGKSSNIIQGFKQSELFKVHTGTDENIFNRGLALSLRKNQVELATFASALKIDANVVASSTSGRKTVSSILTSGLHRSESELEDKHSLKQVAIGGRLAWNTMRGKIAFNHIRFNYDIPISKRPMPYNKYAISGDAWQNTSLDYSWSNSFGFLFGEVAIDKRSKIAAIAGVIKSFDPKLDVSLIIRNMSHEYKAIQSSTITQQGEAGNEQGIFTCFNFTPSSKINIQGFTDHYINRWPVFFNDGIKRGQSYAVQYLWRPNKKNELYIRWRSGQQTNNKEVEPSRTNHLSSITSYSIRLHASSIIGEVLTLRYRSEIVWIRGEYEEKEKGLLSYVEIIIKPPQTRTSISGRYTLFDTDSYASRVYAYERDLLSYHAIPAHYDNGNRSYLVVQYKMNKGVNISAKCIFTNREKDSPPYYALPYHQVRRLDWRIQLLWKIRS